ncbi:MAG TPA: hypothetical protein VKG23_16515 [Thermoanaerobaculia bacterium]|nr:hypothetical protein [Thermoanaerobaculia bacterium]
MHLRTCRIAALIAAALLAAPAATLCASCCVPAADVSVAAPSCCGCDGTFSRPAPADRTAVESRRAPLATSAALVPFRVVRTVRTVMLPSAARSPIPLVPASPFPRRL